MAKYILVLVKKAPSFSVSQLKTLIEIGVNMGTLSLGSVAIPIIFDKGLDPMLLFGLIGALTFWGFAVWLSKKVDL